MATASRVDFGESTTQLTRRAGGELGAQHVVTLPSLAAGTKWFFSVGTARVPLATNAFTVPGKIPRERVPPVSGTIPTARKTEAAKKAPPTRETWGHVGSLPDYFERHGGDFKARDAADYARLAWEFQQRAKTENLPTKVDADGVARIYDPKSGAFAAYNRNGTTKTFFKPGSRDYFDRQPGELVKAKGGTDVKHLCPCCGFPGLREAPRSASGGASYEICPSCGFQFGVSDDDQGYSYARWRALWIKVGCIWASQGIKAPRGWNANDQLDKLRAHRKKLAAPKKLSRRPPQSRP